MPDVSEVGVLAVVGESPITQGELDYWATRKHIDLQNEAARQALLDELILRHAHIEKAKSLGLDQDMDIRAANEGQIISLLKERELMQSIADIELTEEALQSAYQQELESRFAVPAEYDVAVLWFQTRGQAELETRFTERLQQAREEVANRGIPLEEGFGDVAITGTEHRPSRFKGGKLGTLKDVAYNDPLRDTALAIAKTLEPGTISEPTVEADGVYLVRLISKQDAHYRAFEAVRATLEQELRMKMREDLEDTFDAESLKAVDITRF